MNLSDKQLKDLKQIHGIQGEHGNWNYDPYMHGMYNGMELMMSAIENRDPVFKNAPETWIADLPTTPASDTDTVQ